MWKIIAEKHYKTANGYDMKDETTFECDDAENALEVILMLERYGVDRFEYRIIPIEEEAKKGEDENE